MPVICNSYAASLLLAHMKTLLSLYGSTKIINIMTNYFEDNRSQILLRIIAADVDIIPVIFSKLTVVQQ